MSEVKLWYSTPAVEDLARECEEVGTLEEMARIISSGSNYVFMLLWLNNGHSWRVSRNLGLMNVEFECPGGSGDHSDACRKPESTEDVADLLRRGAS